MVGEKAHRIIVSNFDTVSQAELWLTQGAQRATEVFLGLLRTAVLLGAEVVVDRNQVLDGVCFLALGPDRIAQARIRDGITLSALALAHARGLLGPAQDRGGSSGP
ncbi:hypothetical protein [Luteococcus sp. OSA5]|uniref:hypothetical protein n=1 Tax=Luteococcus sp. OSA5 TaxID=3401630 RepID=UPI003B4303C4